MKLSFPFAILFLLSVCLFYTIEASPESRLKRSVAQEKCPKGSTPEECVSYATEKSKTIKDCHKFSIGHNGVIAWQSCGTISCGGLNPSPEDLNLPYPECCSKCL